MKDSKIKRRMSFGSNSDVSSLLETLLFSFVKSDSIRKKYKRFIVRKLFTKMHMVN